MNCQHCGTQEATYHIKTIINGSANELYLCAVCAGETQDGAFANSALTRSLDVFGADFFKSSLFGGGFFRPSGSLGQTRQTLFYAPLAPAAGIPAQSLPAAASEPKEGQIPIVADEALKRRRVANQLRSEMEAAVKEDNFERAAELRDELYRLENTP